MEIGRERTVGDVTIIELHGRMTLEQGSGVLTEKINSLVEQGRRKFLLHLQGMTYVDSAGLGEFVRGYTSVRRQGGDLKLLSPTDKVRTLLALTKLNSVFEEFDVEADAVRSFSEAARV